MTMTPEQREAVGKITANIDSFAHRCSLPAEVVVEMDLFVSAYMIKGPTYDAKRHPFDTIEVVRTGALQADIETTDVWAIRCLGRTWNSKGQWELEPQPSSRTDTYLERNRWTLAEAKVEAAKAAAQPTPASVPR